MRYACPYYRKSTGKQELSLEVQQEAVHSFLSAKKWHVLKEFTEVESGKKHTNRPQLLEALAYCRKHNAVLVIAKLDRLARNVAFISGLMESKVQFVATDYPDASKTMLHMLAVFAEFERDQISIRTKEGLQAAKKRGSVLGKHGKVLAEKNKRDADAFAKQLIPTFEELRNIGITSVRKLADELNRRKVPTFHNKGKWHGRSVWNTIHRFNSINVYN
ncbi:hypothetical protein A4R26_10140 [Niastella populi]|uniref:Resolvase/invertase-type recombinase catalytic domain-containing protein n=2 Tax=Niastella populi TaxID=550983 RepID=A0A1V9GC09_9BACT|nr:hypothetical protein A4R26_10140 [Niastella populi]